MTNKDYSQNGEQYVIEQYFRGRTGTLLDLGANDGITYSNSFALIQQGWSAVLLEPSKSTFKKLTELHRNRSNVLCLNFAVSNVNGEVEFYESGSLVTANDQSLVSTLVEGETKRFAGATTYEKTKVKAYTLPYIKETFNLPKFDFITVDIEGAEDLILDDLDLTDVKLFCIEYNSVEAKKNKYTAHASKYGLKLIHSTLENLIFVR